MPKLTVLLGRKTVQVHDIDKPVIRVGRDEEMDIIIDNPSVSRKHAEFRQVGAGWVVADLGSSNGTFMADARIEAPVAVEIGSEVGMGKFSIVFGKVVGEDADTAHARSATPADSFGGTTQISDKEVQELLKDSERKRKAQIEWESGGRKGTHYLTDTPAVIIGTSELCDVMVPKGPKNHVVVFYRDGKCEIRNLGGGWGGSMKVGGATKAKHTFQPGETAEVAGLKLTFVDEIA